MEQQKILITGGAGFFGELLKKELLQRCYSCVSIDLEQDHISHKNLIAIRGDIRDRDLLDRIARQGNFGAIFHLAAILAHAAKDRDHLWTSNVDGTRNISELAQRYRIPKIVFLSSNCLWGESLNRPVTEEDTPKPVELYGLSKREGEKILLGHRNDFHTVIFRCPTIIDAGRLGLLSILFEFIDEGRKVWVVGGGKNRYQFIYAQDLIDACIRALDFNRTEIFNVGSDNVPTLAETYEYVIEKAGTNARLAGMPRRIAIPLMKLAHALRLSPLGPYQYKMIAEDFEFDTTKARSMLNWRPVVGNAEMLYLAYRYYHDNREAIRTIQNVSAHKQGTAMGVIRLLKWFS